MTSKKEANSYVAGLTAVLIAVAIAVASFVYYLVKPDPNALEPVLLYDEDGNVGVDPGPGMPVPSGPPNVAEPSTPPPA